MSEQKTTIAYKEPISVNLTRGMRGQYSWSVEVRTDLPNKAIQLVEAMDKELRIIEQLEAKYNLENPLK